MSHDSRRFAQFLVALLAASMVATGARSVPVWAQAHTARVRVHGPGSDRVERAVARVLASHGYEVVERRTKPVALRVDGRVRERGSHDDGYKQRVAVQLTVRRAGGEIVARLRLRGASARAAARRVEDELWFAIESSASLSTAPIVKEPGAGQAGKADGEPAAGPIKAEPIARTQGSSVMRVAGARRRESRGGSSGSESSAAGGLRGPAPSTDAPAGRWWLSIAVGPELYGRHYSYRDDVFQMLREYDLAATPALTATAELYPMASRSGALAALGLAGRFSHVPGFDTEDAAGSRYTTAAQSYMVGGRYRFRIASIELAGALDYGAQSFSMAPVADAPDPDFPDAAYRYLRAGIGAAAPLWSRLAIAGRAGYRQVLASGEIESDDFFPRSSARGLDVELELSWALVRGFDVRAGATLERYGHALDPEPGDARVAGGALDQYPRLFFRVGYTR